MFYLHIDSASLRIPPCDNNFPSGPICSLESIGGRNYKLTNVETEWHRRCQTSKHSKDYCSIKKLTSAPQELLGKQRTGLDSAMDFERGFKKSLNTVAFTARKLGLPQSLGHSSRRRTCMRGWNWESPLQCHRNLHLKTTYFRSPFKRNFLSYKTFLKTENRKKSSLPRIS